MGSIAEKVVDQLALWGIEAVFGVPGDDILSFFDAVERDGRIRAIYAAHEAGAAFMAANCSRLTGRLGVCTSGAAGFINLMEGLCSAYLDGCPVLAITGQTDITKVGTRAKQYLNQQLLAAPIARFTELAISESSVIPLLGSAAEIALTLGGVGHLSIPKDIWTMESTAVSVGLPEMPRYTAEDGVAGDIAGAAVLLGNSKRPIILAGYETHTCRDAVMNLADTLGAAVILSQEAKGAISEDNERVISGVGEAWLPKLVNEADCAIIIGTASFEKAWLPQSAVIQAASKPWMLYEQYRAQSLSGDIKSIAEKLLYRLRDYKCDAGWLERIAETKSERTEMLRLDSIIDQEPLHPAGVMAALDCVMAENAVISIDEGTFNHWFDRSVFSRSQTVLLSSRWRNMGGGLPGAIAAKLAYPEKQVICIVGDGGLLMSLGELSVIKRYDLDIKIIVINNSAYGLEIDKSEAAGLSTDWLRLPAIDFAEAARAFGIQGYKAAAQGEVRAAFEKAMQIQGPALADVSCASVRLPRVK